MCPTNLRRMCLHSIMLGVRIVDGGHEMSQHGRTSGASEDETSGCWNVCADSPCKAGGRGLENADGMYGMGERKGPLLVEARPNTPCLLSLPPKKTCFFICKT